MADRQSAQIVATAFSYGSKHDFQLFKDDGSDFADHLRILADAGTKDWRICMRTIRRRSRNPSITL